MDRRKVIADLEQRRPQVDLNVRFSAKSQCNLTEIMAKHGLTIEEIDDCIELALETYRGLLSLYKNGGSIVYRGPDGAEVELVESEDWVSALSYPQPKLPQ